MAHQDRFKLIPEVFLLLIKNNAILLSRRFQTGYYDGNYGLVAGHAEAHEKMTHAMAREAFEEAGIILDPLKLKVEIVIHRFNVDHERIGFYFTISHYEGEPSNMEPEKCDDMRWFPLDTLPENLVPEVAEAIRCYKAGIHYSEFNWE